MFLPVKLVLFPAKTMKFLSFFKTWRMLTYTLKEEVHYTPNILPNLFQDKNPFYELHFAHNKSNIFRLQLVCFFITYIHHLQTIFFVFTLFPIFIISYGVSTKQKTKV